GLIAATLVLSGMLAGCGDGGGAAPGSNTVDADLAALFDQVDGGELLLRASGAVTASVETPLGSDARESVIFRPSLGGRNTRSGHNAEGPYSLTVYADAVHEANSGNSVTAELNLIL